MTHIVVTNAKSQETEYHDHNRKRLLLFIT